MSSFHTREKSGAGELWSALRARAGTVERLAALTLRYGLVLVVAWIGAMKFTAYEAHGIEPLVASSPLLGWTYALLDVRAFSSALGLVELLIAALLALRPVAPRAAAAGSVLAVAMFLTTLTFLLSAPGWQPSLGFPAVSAMPGQFLLKDVVLLGAALWSLGDALQADAVRTGAKRSA